MPSGNILIFRATLPNHILPLFRALLGPYPRVPCTPLSLSLSLTTIHTVYIMGPTQIGLNTGGCVSLVIYLIVSSCCLGPEVSYQLDHLKLRVSTASQQFILYIFCVPPRKG